MYEPPPPQMITRIDKFGICDLPFQITFQIVFCSLTVLSFYVGHGHPAVGVGRVLWIELVWAYAAWALGTVCSERLVLDANEQEVERYGRELAAAELNAPVEYIVLDRDSGKFVDVRRKLKPRPPTLIDPALGRTKRD